MLPRDGSAMFGQDILSHQLMLLKLREDGVRIHFDTHFLASSKQEAVERFRFVLHNVRAMKIDFDFRVDLGTVTFCFANLRTGPIKYV